MPRIVKRGKVYYAEYTDPEKARRTTGTDDCREDTRILGELLAKSYCPRSTSEVDPTVTIAMNDYCVRLNGPIGVVSGGNSQGIGAGAAA